MLHKPHCLTELDLQELWSLLDPNSPQYYTHASKLLQIISVNLLQFCVRRYTAIKLTSVPDIEGVADRSTSSSVLVLIIQRLKPPCLIFQLVLHEKLQWSQSVMEYHILSNTYLGRYFPSCTSQGAEQECRENLTWEISCVTSIAPVAV